MRRGLMHGMAWVLSTGAAVTLSWWGVHTVLSGTAYEPPRALPIADAARSEAEEAKPRPSLTYRPGKSPEPGTSSSTEDRNGENDTARKPSAAPRGSAPAGRPVLVRNGAACAPARAIRRTSGLPDPAGHRFGCLRHNVIPHQ
ncbi:hypothetical protein [Streptomyces sp. NPDC002215]|uniref:hypothetical protein n=1 Tax=Streptomyces sp. NPDC002215 TaxID=3154412 RepID=UPI00331AE900